MPSESPALKSIENELTARLFEQLCHGSLADLGALASEVLGNPVLILDNALQLLVQSGFAAEDGHAVCTLLEKNLDAMFIDTLKERLSPDTPLTIEGCDTHPPLILLPVYEDSLVTAYFILVCVCAPIHREQDGIIRSIGAAIRVELQKSGILRKSMGSIPYEQFLLDLIMLPFEDERNNQIFLKRLKDLRSTLLPPYHLFLIRPSSNAGGCRYGMNNLGHEMRSIFPNSISCLNGNDIIMLNGSVDNEPMSEFQRESFSAFLQQNGLTCMISLSFTTLVFARKKHQHCLDVIDLDMRLRPSLTIRFTKDMLIYHMIHKCNSIYAVINSVDPQLMLIRDYDRANNSELFATLYYYLIYQKNTALVTKRLNIHRNTLFYRLSKINSICHLDLNNEEEVFRIMLNFKILEFSALESGRKMCFKVNENQGLTE